jgi:hypothetical protein
MHSIFFYAILLIVIAIRAEIGFSSLLSDRRRSSKTKIWIFLGIFEAVQLKDCEMQTRCC